jgi:hypothetical protein
LAVNVPVELEPLNARLPDQAPEAVQAVALLLDQVSIEAVPELTVLGLARSVTTGGKVGTVTVTDCVAVPPSPVQVRSYSVVLVSAPVDQVPLVATAPLQAPEAVHAVASVELQVKVELAPLATVVGAAVNVTVGAGPVTTTSADCEAEPPVPVQVRV